MDSDAETVASLETIQLRVRSARTELDDAFALRDHPDGIARWKHAALRARTTTEEFESYVGRIQDALTTGSPASIDAAIDFLEADPWCFRSGYAKGRLLRKLRHTKPDGEQERRLVAIVLRYVDNGARLEFRDVTRLARQIGSRDLRAGLRSRLHGPDVGVARRGPFALMDLSHPRLNDADLRKARRIILDQLRRHAAQADWWNLPGWPERLATRLTSTDWTNELLEHVRGGGPDRYGAVVLLAKHSKLNASEEDREMLRALLIAELRPGGSPHWLEGLAVLVDSPELRRQLEHLVNFGDEDIVWRAHWARNAIRRAHEES